MILGFDPAFLASLIVIRVNGPVRKDWLSVSKILDPAVGGVGIVLSLEGHRGCVGGQGARKYDGGGSNVLTRKCFGPRQSRR